MRGNAISWFEIYVQDISRAKAFYEIVFETRLQKLTDANPELWAFPGDVNTYGCNGALAFVPGFPSGGNSVIVYFACEDCAVQAARAANAGGSIVREKMSIGPHGFIALVRDTEGTLIGLHSMK